MIREDRELLAELARLNTDMAQLGMRIMEGSASAAEQAHYAERLIAAGERLRRRAEKMGGTVIEGEVVVSIARDQSHLVGTTIGQGLASLPNYLQLRGVGGDDCRGDGGRMRNR